MKHGSRLSLIDHPQDFRQEWLKRFIPTIRTMQDDQTNLQLPHVLLIQNVGIHCEENVKVWFNALKQFPVCNTSPALPRNRCRNMVRKISQQPSREAFVQNDLHAGTASNTSCLADSSTAITCSRFTVGKSYRNRSIESPASRQSNRFCTGTRVPAKTGVPFKISGDDVMMFDRFFTLGSMP